MKKLMKKKHSTEWWPGNLTWRNAEGEIENFNIELRTRGNLRKEICYYPPLKMKISKEDKKKYGLKWSRKIKLVTACKGTSLMEEYVLREHLMYKMYNEITEASFRVQLVKFTFVDAAGKKDNRETFGFFIEDIEDVCKRLEYREIEPKIMSYKTIADESLDRMSIFQYAIGNTDWYVSNNHNLKFAYDTIHKTIQVIPYDFDFAGLVNTTYAAPSVGIPTQSILQRVYIGECRTKEEWLTLVQPYQAVKEKWFGLISEDRFLNAKSKKTMTKFLTKFYKVIENEKKLNNQFKSSCDAYLRRWDN